MLSANLSIMKNPACRFAPQYSCLALLLAGMLWVPTQLLNAQTTPAAQTTTTTPEVPDWALPSGPNHKQYPPPPDFHRPTKTFDTPIGIFQGQSDIGDPLVPGNATYDASTKQYTVNSAGYNIWYTRDEFRYVWKKMSG